MARTGLDARLFRGIPLSNTAPTNGQVYTYNSGTMQREPGSGGGSGTVTSVTGLNTDNSDPANPVVKISVDGVTITGLGTPGSPLIASAGAAPGGFQYDIQVNDGAGGLHGDSSFSYDYTNKEFFVGDLLASLFVDNTNGIAYLKTTSAAMYLDGVNKLSRLGDVYAEGNNTLITVNDNAQTYTLNRLGTGVTGIVSVSTLGVLGNTTTTGTGSVVLATSPTLVTPTLGVATATSINKLTITAPATSATLTIANGKTLTMSNTLTFTGTDTSSVAFGTGGTVTYTSNNLSVFAATTSAQLLGVISDETGTGSLVFATSPTFVTPLLGTPTSGNLANCTFPTLNQNTSGSAATLTTTRTIWGQNFNGSANVTGTLALGASDLTLTGSVGATGARATKVWTAALESTAMPTVGGTAILTSLTAPQFTTIELGAATDTTLARVSAGVISVEGVRVITSAGTTSGTILKNNGTTFVASTETYAAPGTSGNILKSDGTNWTSAVPTFAPKQIRITVPGALVLDTAIHQGLFWYNDTGATITISNVAFTVAKAAVGAGAAAGFNVYKSSGTAADGIDTSAVNLFTSTVDLTTTNVSATNTPNTTTVEAGRYVSLRVITSAGATNTASEAQVIISYS